MRLDFNEPARLHRPQLGPCEITAPVQAIPVRLIQSQAAILREVRMPFTPEDGQSPSSGKMGINDVAFSSDLSILAAANGHGVAIFRVRDGEVLYSSKTKEDVTRLLGVSNDGKQIAFSATSSYMPVTNWKTWNLSEGTDPEDAQGSLDEWKLTPDLRIGVGGSGSRIQVFAPGKEQPLANFDPPIAREEGGAKIRMGGPQWDLSADGRKLAIADNRAIEIWAVTPPLLPD